MALKRIGGGRPLQETLRQYAKKFEDAGTLRVGFLENGNVEADGTPVAAVAAYNEFVTRTTPSRPFFRDAIAENTGKWAAAVAHGIQEGRSGTDILSGVGEVMIGDIKESIETLNDPPLAPTTVERKGFDKPLIETWTMRDNVKASVIGKDET